MADMDLKTAGKMLAEIVQAADGLVSDGTLPEEARDLFVAELFRSALRLSEGDAMLRAQKEIRDSAIRSKFGIV